MAGGGARSGAGGMRAWICCLYLPPSLSATPPPSSNTDPAAAPTPAAMTTSGGGTTAIPSSPSRRRGQLYRLGRHRLARIRHQGQRGQPPRAEAQAAEHRCLAVGVGAGVSGGGRRSNLVRWLRLTGSSVLARSLAVSVSPRGAATDYGTRASGQLRDCRLRATGTVAICEANADGRGELTAKRKTRS
uniref:Uncharacterized protein n=2 Tax=Oryza sativa subsp. japonica TaxID=39947 RepID=Q2R972_ORYSJ|nr:hypothetical protein LOC_Os11g09740 [Oryza sativa Japonica Group]ABA91926.1 hypothetical protein LOC_Os11g09740 [Oryza sativa Japonica Group]